MKTSPLHLDIGAQYRHDPLRKPTLEDDLNNLFQLRQRIREFSSHLSDWLLGGNSIEEARLVRAFDEKGPTDQLIDVLREKQKKKPKNDLATTRVIGIWNGEDHPNEAALTMLFRSAGGPSTVDFSTYCPDVLLPEVTLKIAQAMIDIWQPLFVSSAPTYYEKVFKDRPGVGGLLYLPRVLTTQQVPEAHVLIPVMDDNKKKQTGTIIVSVTDEAFSEHNPEHVKIANAIEIRLVDQDLLPRYSEI